MPDNIDQQVVYNTEEMPQRKHLKFADNVGEILVDVYY